MLKRTGQAIVWDVYYGFRFLPFSVYYREKLYLLDIFDIGYALDGYIDIG
jgi:hypothetical protein